MSYWKNNFKSFLNEHKYVIDKSIVTVLITLFLVQIINIAIKPHLLQWDFLVYWTGPKAFFEFGSNPYLLQNLRQVEPTLGLPYTYPPLTLFFFRIFTYLPFIYSYELWLLVCVGAVGMTLWVWHRDFFRWKFTAMHLAIILCSFHALLVIRLRTGNVNFLEHALIWVALGSLLKNKVIPFVLILAVVSQFKLTPILFSFVPLFLHRKNSVWITVVTLGSILILFSLNFVISSGLTWDFFYYIVRWQEIAAHNPCMRVVLWVISNKFFTDLVPKLFDIPWVEWVYGLFVIFISVGAFNVFRRTRIFLPSDERKKYMIYFFILSYALVLPRFKIYSYFLIVLPLLHYFDLALHRRVPKPHAIFIFILAFFPFIDSHSLPFVLEIVSHYAPLFTTFFLWLDYRQLLTEPVRAS